MAMLHQLWGKQKNTTTLAEVIIMRLTTGETCLLFNLREHVCCLLMLWIEFQTAPFFSFTFKALVHGVPCGSVYCRLHNGCGPHHSTECMHTHIYKVQVRWTHPVSLWSRFTWLSSVSLPGFTESEVTLRFKPKNTQHLSYLYLTLLPISPGGPRGPWKTYTWVL